MKNIATTDFLMFSFLAYKSPTRFKKGFTTKSIIKTYRIANPMTYNELTKLPAFTIAITTAKIHQAVMSSAAAQVITMVPNRVLCIPRS